MDARPSPALRAWFGSSRVVNDEGSPLVVYHGTQQQFSVFRRGRWPGTINDIGFWFASEPTTAEIFAGPGGHVMPAYLKIASPRYIDSSDELTALWCEHAGGDRRLRAGDTERFRQWLAGQGHDGIVISAADVDGFASGIYLVALEPTQIKSAIGRDLAAIKGAVVYHYSSPTNRASILTRGLIGSDNTSPGGDRVVFVTDTYTPQPGMDYYVIDATALALEPDDTTTAPADERWYAVYGDIAPNAIRGARYAGGAFDPTNPDIYDTPAPRPVLRQRVDEGLTP